MSAARKIDPYAELGVSRDASKEDVKAAYRRRSKSAHPDAGGSAERFAALALARDVLSDDVRRAKYDATGEVDGGVDNSEGEALQMALHAIFLVIQYVEENGLNPENFDLAGDAVKRLERIRNDFAGEMGKLKAQAAQLRKLAKRFRSRKADGVNRIGALIEAQAADRERMIVDGERKRGYAARAIEIMRDHEFSYEHINAQRQARSTMQNLFEQVLNNTSGTSSW